jgi:hypothetical protein
MKKFHNETDYIELSERVNIINLARVSRPKLSLPLKTLTYPGHNGAPSQLPEKKRNPL